MSKLLLPERWVTKFIKSATNGRTISPRIRRILTLMVISIWLLGLVWIFPVFYSGFISVSNYYHIVNEPRLKYRDFSGDVVKGDTLLNSVRESLVQEFLQNKHPNDPLTTQDLKVIHGEVAIPDSLKAGLYNYVSPLDGSDLSGLEDARTHMVNLLVLPAYLVMFALFFIISWVITRLIYWVIDADKGNTDD